MRKTNRLKARSWKKKQKNKNYREKHKREKSERAPNLPRRDINIDNISLMKTK